MRASRGCRAVAAVVLAACGGTPFGGGDDEPPGDARGTRDGRPDGPSDGTPGVFDPAITRVSIEVDFEQGNAPYTGAIVGGGDTFDLSHANLSRLFTADKELVLPRTVGAMQDIGSVPDEQLTVADLLALAAQHRDQADTATTRTYYVLFVSGAFADANGPNPNVLGVSVGGTGVIAMFKDVIRGTDVLGVPHIVRYVEQSTLIHEIGHAVGLVDNGVAMASPHKDTAHGAHCDNEDCVMFWLNEGASDAAAFVQQHVLASDTVVFDARCLADVDALTGGP